MEASTDEFQGISVASYNVGVYSSFPVSLVPFLRVQGCFFGAIACIWIGDVLGRRKTIFLGSLIMIIGAALQCSAFNLGHFISGRVITGKLAS